MSLPAQGAGYEANPADVQAYDVRTGKVAWVFHSIPLPGEFGYDTWPDGAFKTAGGVHNWSELTVDEQNGIVFIPTGTARFDFYGGDRQGDNLFANSIVALDARTGKRLWHYQMVHHDLWDYDLPHAPKLLTLRQNGRTSMRSRRRPRRASCSCSSARPASRSSRSRSGRCRRPTCRASELADAAVPDQAGAVRAPVVHREGHQPVPAGGRAGGDGERLRSARNEGLFTPPSLRGTIQMPGHNGGANWGSTGVDPLRGELYIVAKNMPTMIRLVRSDEEPTAGGALGGGPPSPIITPDPKKQADCRGEGGAGERTVRYNSPYDFMLSPTNGMTALGPPWSLLTAYDLNTGEIKWQVPDGGVTPPPGSNATCRPTPARTCRGAVRS